MLPYPKQNWRKKSDQFCLFNKDYEIGLKAENLQTHKLSENKILLNKSKKVTPPSQLSNSVTAATCAFLWQQLDFGVQSSSEDTVDQENGMIYLSPRDEESASAYWFLVADNSMMINMDFCKGW